jgi:hypothetical protein
MVTAMRVAGDKEGKGGKAMAATTSGKEDSNGDKEGNGNGNEDGRQVTAMTMKVAIVTAMRVVVNEEGNGNSNKGGGQVEAKRAKATATAMMTRLVGATRARARTARGIVMAMRVVGNKENKNRKMMAMATRVTGLWTATAMKRAMVMATMEASEEEGNDKGGKSDDDGNEEGDGKEDSDGK